MRNHVRFVAGVLGNVTSLLLYGAPIVTFVRVIKKGLTEDISGFPYAIALLNSLLYTWYGSPLISNGSENILVVTINGVGIGLGLLFVSIYLKFAPPKSKSAMVKIVVGVVTVFASIGVVSLLGLHDQNDRKIAGRDFSNDRQRDYKLVIRTKSVEFMPFYFCLFAFINSCLWMTYFLIDQNLMLASPNIVGVPLGMGQIVLFCMYRKRPGLEDENTGAT